MNCTSRHLLISVRSNVPLFWGVPFLTTSMSPPSRGRIRSYGMRILAVFVCLLGSISLAELAWASGNDALRSPPRKSSSAASPRSSRKFQPIPEFAAIFTAFQEERFAEAIEQCDRLEPTLPARTAQLAAFLAIRAMLFDQRPHDALARLERALGKYSDVTSPQLMQLDRRLAGYLVLPADEQEAIVSAERVRSGLATEGDPLPPSISGVGEPLPSLITGVLTLLESAGNNMEVTPPRSVESAGDVPFVREWPWQSIAVVAIRSALTEEYDDCLAICERAAPRLSERDAFLLRLDIADELASRSYGGTRAESRMKFCRELLNEAAPTAELELLRVYSLARYDFSQMMFDASSAGPEVFRSSMAKSARSGLEAALANPACPPEIAHGASARLIAFSRTHDLLDTRQRMANFFTHFPESRNSASLCIDSAIVAGNTGNLALAATWLEEAQRRFPNAAESANIPSLFAHFGFQDLQDPAEAPTEYFSGRRLLIWSNLCVLALVAVVVLFRRFRASNVRDRF